MSTAAFSPKMRRVASAVIRGVGTLTKAASMEKVGAAAGTLAGNGLNGLQASKTTAVAPGGSDRNLGGKAKQVLPAKEAAKEVAVDYPITPIVTRY